MQNKFEKNLWLISEAGYLISNAERFTTDDVEKLTREQINYFIEQVKQVSETILNLWELDYEKT